MILSQENLDAGARPRLARIRSASRLRSSTNARARPLSPASCIYFYAKTSETSLPCQDRLPRRGNVHHDRLRHRLKIARRLSQDTSYILGE